MDNLENSFWLILTLFLTTAMLSCSSAEITDSTINLTYEGNFEKENAKDIILIAEMPLTDETQKILKINAQNYSIEKGNGKETMKINVGSANNYSLNFIVEKKIYEIKFDNENNKKGNGSEIQNFLIGSGNVEWNEEIKKKAEEITCTNDSCNNKEDNKDIEDALKVFKIAKFVHAHLTYDYNSEILSARDVFMSGRATCMGYTNLFISMCRSIGIPARAVGGIASTDKGFERHAYAEVFINEQWIPIDPTFGQFPADASHIAIYSDNEARGINVELKFIGKNVSHKGIMSAKFISLKDEKLISGRIINKNLTGKNSVMPLNVELTNNKNFYVFGVCKISSRLKADENEKIFYLSPYEKRNITFKVFVPEYEEGFLYFYRVNVRCKDLNLTTNFTVDTDKTGNIYNGVVIERINTSAKEIELKNLNNEGKNRVNVSIIVQDKDKIISENKSIVVEKGGNYVLKYEIEYPAKNFVLTVKCTGGDFSDSKEVFVNVIDNKDNISDEISNQWQNFVKNASSNWYLIAAIVLMVIAFIIFIFKKH